MINHKTRAAFSCLALLAIGCGGSKTPADSPQENVAEPTEEAAVVESTDSEERAADGKLSIPSACQQSGEVCTPAPRWVKALCQDVYPAVALYLFQSSQPFTHAYLSRKTKAVNASGGATSGSEWLEFDEEVVLLYHRAANTGGIQVSGANGGYDAMRLDGSCVTLDSSEVRLDEPPVAKHSPIPWRYLGDDVEDALLEVSAIKDAYIARRKECKGAFSGEVSSKCVQLDEQLNKTIVSALKTGKTNLPEPNLRP